MSCAPRGRSQSARDLCFLFPLFVSPLRGSVILQLCPLRGGTAYSGHRKHVLLCPVWGGAGLISLFEVIAARAGSGSFCLPAPRFPVSLLACLRFGPFPDLPGAAGLRCGPPGARSRPVRSCSPWVPPRPPPPHPHSTLRPPPPAHPQGPGWPNPPTHPFGQPGQSHSADKS